MKYWFGHPVKECVCGFSTPDEDEFKRHISRKGHSEKTKKSVEKAVKEKEAREEKNGEEVLH